MCGLEKAVVKGCVFCYAMQAYLIIHDAYNFTILFDAKFEERFADIYIHCVCARQDVEINN